MAVLFADRFGLFGLRVAFGPAGETVSCVVIAPWKPFRLWNVIWDVPDLPGEIMRLAGLDVTMKSGILTVTLSECVS